MNIAIDGSLEKWLLQQAANHRDFFKGKNILLDVGAYHGDFAATCLSNPVIGLDRAVLFEPNPVNFQFLQQRFSANPAVQLEPFACDVAAGERKFFCQGETYTGSLLEYSTASTAPMQETPVRCVVLDEFLKTANLIGRVGLLKIDTQGNDLRVLQSAPNLLTSTRPWVVCEQITQPLYKNQASPHEIAQFLAGHDYVMAAQFNEFYSLSGWLAWSDACYVPREIIGSSTENYLPRPAAGEAHRARRSVAQRIRRQIQRTFRHGGN